MSPITLDDAMAEVETFDTIPFFLSMKPRARVAIAESIVRMVNTPDGGPLRNSHGTLIKVTPSERLRVFAQAFRSARLTDGFPGIGEMEGFYCNLYPAGDGVDRWCSIPGYTFEDNENGTNIPILPVVEEPASYQIQAGDEPIGDEFEAVKALILAKSKVEVGVA